MRKTQFVLKLCLGVCVVFAIGFPIGNLLSKFPLLGKIEKEQEKLETPAKATFVVENNNLPDNIPSEIHDCLPVNTNKNFQLLANLIDKDKQYFLVQYTSIHNQSDAASLIMSDDLGCLVLRPGESIVRSLYFYIDENIANKITLKEVENYIAYFGSKKKYQEEVWKFAEEIGEGQADNYYRVFPEMIWAWKKLEIAIPTNVKIIKEFEGIEY